LYETAQGLGVVNVLQELHKSMLFGKQSELDNDPSQLPADNQWDASIS
jgi:hypothetical protein